LFLKISEIYFAVIKQDTTSEHWDIKRQRSEFILPLRGVRYWQHCTHQVGITVSSIHFAGNGTFPLHEQRVSLNCL
jgi:hypothetical protein